MPEVKERLMILESGPDSSALAIDKICHEILEGSDDFLRSRQDNIQ